MLYNGRHIFQCAHEFAQDECQEYVSFFIKNKNENRKSEKLNGFLFIECDVRHSNQCQAHKSHIKWTADFANHHRIQYFFIVILPHYLAVIEARPLIPLAFPFINHGCQRRRKTFQWSKNEKLIIPTVQMVRATTHMSPAT